MIRATLLVVNDSKSRFVTKKDKKSLVIERKQIRRMEMEYDGVDGM